MKREGKTHFLPKTSKGSTNYTSTCGLFMAPLNSKLKKTENLDEVTCSMCLKIINNKKRESIPGVAGLLKLQKQFAHNKDWKNVQAINDTLKYIRDLETRLHVESNEDAVKAKDVAVGVKIPNLDAKVWYRLTQVVTQQLGVKPEEVKPESNWVEDLGADSLDTVELVMGLEEEFEIEIPDEAAENMTCPLDAYNYVIKHAKRS